MSYVSYEFNGGEGGITFDQFYVAVKINLVILRKFNVFSSSFVHLCIFKIMLSSLFKGYGKLRCLRSKNRCNYSCNSLQVRPTFTHSAMSESIGSLLPSCP